VGLADGAALDLSGDASGDSTGDALASKLVGIAGPLAPELVQAASSSKAPRQPERFSMPAA
jgi:hypothetical protein